MAWSYRPLWHLLVDKGISRNQLRLAINASSSTFAKLSKNEPVNMEVLERICAYLECSIEQVVEYVTDQGE